MLYEEVKRLIEEALEENPSLFLIQFEIKEDNQILVVIDGDQGVSVNDCIAVSRKIEHNLDRDEQDFSLEVTSAGAASPLELPRQFKKNIGRKLSVKTQEQQFEAKLEEVTDEEVTLRWKAREPKPVGKGKVTVNKEAVLKYADIVEAKVMITF
ncbi:ribosome assembly cofactor RimP [Mesonia aestuariivivens]|uniref:Ribosome maturation factor RimP n=1 Tax=Mesonia aestuariivivens TaxID=2796128 RepID=A0ABS6W4L0_9FLAO|nr:ribosome assembly cofactor RimP [Mesonia aestuariivivens]MBW2962462.1 ribosome assembly cofactor RimP [Mesonia aestuariivivens]